MRMGTPAKSDHFKASHRYSQLDRSSRNAILTTSTLMILIGLVAPSFLSGQTGPVQMNFAGSDQMKISSPTQMKVSSSVRMNFSGSDQKIVSSKVQTKFSDSVRMTFSDRGVFANLSDDKNSAQDPETFSMLASGSLPIQESDFEPNSDEPQIKNPASDLVDTPQEDLDDAIDKLRLKGDEEIKDVEAGKQEIGKQETDDLDLGKDDLNLETDDLELESDNLEIDKPETDDTDDKETDDPSEQLDSDEPVEAPTFKLTDETLQESSTSDEDQIEPSQPVKESFSDGYQLPAVADVRDQISSTPMANTAQRDPGGLIANDQNSGFAQRFVGPNSNYSEISGKAAAAKYKTWRAHNVYHRPTYFEDDNLELNGNRRPYQNLASGISFFGTIPRIPYLIGEHHPREKIYTHGQDRPGDVAPFRAFQPTYNRRGRVFQTVATLGLFLP